jgi:EAL domain-containing protein (putative c-di-GMP-specific phosphodiesterase class I)
VSSIINLAHSLRLNVVAEGVETEEQARLLRLLNCDEMQGFLFGKPLPSELLPASYCRPGRKRRPAREAVTLGHSIVRLFSW